MDIEEQVCRRGNPTSERVRDLLDLTAARVLAENRDLSRVFLDVSQGHLRRNYTSAEGLGPCFTRSTELYYFGQDRVVLPQEMLAMLGYTQPVQVPESVRPRDLKRMLGGGMSLPCVGTVLLSLHIMRSMSAASV